MTQKKEHSSRTECQLAEDPLSALVMTNAQAKLGRWSDYISRASHHKLEQSMEENPKPQGGQAAYVQ